jgi:hypothetical protein
MKKVTQGKERNQMGRPRLNPETVRSNRIVTFVTNSEMAKLERKADQERVSLSSAVHQILSEFLREA